MRQYGSFVVRWWQAGPEVYRLHIRHIQSDAELAVAALPEALAWMAARVGEGGRDPPVGATDDEAGRVADRGPT